MVFVYKPNLNLNAFCKTMEWTDNLVLQLIQLYKEHPVIWDQDHPQHKLPHNKTAAWAQMALAMGIEVEDIKRKMASILGSFRRERRKIESSSDYRSQWYAFAHLGFLLNNGNRTSDPLDRKLQHNPKVIVVKNEPIEVESANKPIKKLFPKKRARTLEFAGLGQQPSASSSGPSTQTKSAAPAASDSPSTHNHQKDEFTTFGEYIASKLRKMDQRSCSYVQKAISDAIFDAEMGKYYVQEDVHREDTFFEIKVMDSVDNNNYNDEGEAEEVEFEDTGTSESQSLFDT